MLRSRLVCDSRSATTFWTKKKTKRWIVARRSQGCITYNVTAVTVCLMHRLERKGAGGIAGRVWRKVEENR